METDAPLPEEVTANSVYARCDTYAFQGVELQPFTAQRQAAAMACGLKWGSLIPSDYIDCGDGKMTYKQLFADTVLVVWLCTQSVADVRAAIRCPDAAADLAFEWASSKGITLKSQMYGEALKVFSSIVEDITISTGDPQYGDTEKGAPIKNA